jgi:opacity protein-like surface antigen
MRRLSLVAALSVVAAALPATAAASVGSTARCLAKATSHTNRVTWSGNVIRAHFTDGNQVTLRLGVKPSRDLSAFPQRGTIGTIAYSWTGKPTNLRLRNVGDCLGLIIAVPGEQTTSTARGGRSGNPPA